MKAKSTREAESRWETLSLELESLTADLVAAQEGVAQAEAGLKECDETVNEQLAEKRLSAVDQAANESVEALLRSKYK
jgi:hypothetical protein